MAGSVAHALPYAPWTSLAPMEGVTHPVLRALVAEHGGLGLLCTEFVRITATPTSPRALRRVVEKVPGLPLSVQVMGRERERMAEAAAWIHEAGADVVDINLGCPSPKAVRGGVGAAMLKDLGLLRDVVGALRENVPGVLSAKMRAGMDDVDGVLDRAFVLVEAGVDFLAVHPRRQVDQYGGVADWRIIRTLAQELPVPVVGNGDCWYAADALRMRAETGCAGVMIGRPALRNPWIFRQIADLEAGREPFAPSGEDVVAWIERFCAAWQEREGRIPLGRLKELVRYLGRAVPDEGVFGREALRSADAGAIVEVAKRHLAHRGPDELDLHASPAQPLERAGSVALSAPLPRDRTEATSSTATPWDRPPPGP